MSELQQKFVEQALDIWKVLLVSVAPVAGAILVALLLHYLVFLAAGKMASRTRGIADNSLVQHGRRPARLLFVLLAIFPVLPMADLSEGALATVRQFLSMGMTAAVGWLVVAFTGVIQDVVAAKHDITKADNLTARQIHTRVRVLRRLLVAAIVTVTACLILMSIPSIRQIGITLFASAGIAGLVAGMAARPALSNLIAGVQLALTEPIRLDDVVIVEGEWGWIEEIRPTYVVVRIWDLRRLIVPLSYFIEHPFQNWTRKTADILGTVFVYVDYTVPVDEVRKQLLRILEASGLWDKKVWNLQVTKSAEQTLELRALMSAPTSGKAWDLRCHVREELVKYLQREYPQSLPRIRAEIRQTDEKAAVPDKRPPPEVIRDGTSSFAASGKVAPSADSQGS
jgi:small-conductance mechanosensitive channel